VRRVFLAAALLLAAGVLVGLVSEPDDGTAVSDGPASAVSVAIGANHAKPLPKVPSATALWGLVFSAILLAALVRSAWIVRPGHPDLAPRLGGFHGGPSGLRAPPLAA
jgi:hypothetical protein